MIEVILFFLGLAWIIFASVHDLRKREVANWLNFSLIVFALGIRFFYSLFAENFSYFYQGIFGLVVFLILGNVFYYSRLFGGGDAKLMIALGPVIGISTGFLANLKIFFFFLFLFFFFGAIYGFSFTIFLSIKNFKNFTKEFKKRLANSRKIILLVALVSLVLILLGFLESFMFVVGVLVLFFPYFYIYAKTVDSVCMIKKIKTRNLTEGDWLYQQVRIGNKLIKPSWEGINKKEVILIKKKLKEVKIKQGIAFVPVFLLAFLALFYLWKTGLWYSFW